MKRGNVETLTPFFDYEYSGLRLVVTLNSNVKFTKLDTITNGMTTWEISIEQ